MEEHHRAAGHEIKKAVWGRVVGGALSPAAARKGYRVVFLLAFAAGLLAELLLFTRVQMDQIGGVLKDDFRIVVVKSEKNKERAADIEEALKSLKGAARVVFVDKEARLKKLREADPELVAAVLSVGGNPLPDTWEIELEENAIGGADAWTETVWKVPGVMDVRYKPLEAYAILHALFYGRLIDLGFYGVAFVFVLFAVMVLTYRKTGFALLSALKNDIVWFFAGAAGAGLSAFAAYGLVYPIKYLSPLWVWPALWLHLVVCCACGLGAWVLCQWKNERY